MQLEIMEVSPEQAEVWLASQKRNRALSPFTIKRYARMMDEGSWIAQTNESIAFDSNGQLIDGQHRLAAVIRHGKPVRMAITFGCDAHIGIARTRSVHDVAQIVFDEKLPRNTAAIIRAMYDNDTMTHFEIVNAFMHHREAIGFAAQVLRSATDRNVCVAPVQAGIAKAFYHVPAETLERFAKALRTGIMQYMNDATAIRLGKMLQKQADGKRNSLTAYERTLCTEFAIGQYCRGKAIKAIKLPDREVYPLPMEAGHV